MVLSLLDLTIAAVVGAGVGFLSGIFGLGGGFLIVPMLNIIVGIPIEFAVGAGACQVLGPATTSLLARRVDRQSLQFPLTILGGLFVGVFSGAYAIDQAKILGEGGPIELFGYSVKLIDFIVLLTYLLLLLGIGGFVLWESFRHRHLTTAYPKRVGLLRAQIPPLIELGELPGRLISIPLLAGFGLTVGFLSGFLGMSGGLILLPGLIYLWGMSTQQAVKCSLLIVWLVALQNTVAHAWHGHVNLLLVAALLAGGTIGARLGSEIGVTIDGKKLRSHFGWLLIFTAGMIAVKIFSLFQPTE